jgi:thiol-disulfide isomerase/thioredoxin
VRRRTLLAAVPAAAVALAGCARRPSASGSTFGQQQAADPRAGTAVTFVAAERRPAPPVAGELLDGTAFDIAGWRGKVVVVNWWGSWCAPCRAEAPDLQAAYQATKELGVEFLGVDVRDGRDAAKAFQEAFGITYPSLFDPAGRVALGFADVPPTVVPSTALLDRRLRVAAVFRKRVTGRELEAAVRALATESGA